MVVGGNPVASRGRRTRSLMVVMMMSKGWCQLENERDERFRMPVKNYGREWQSSTSAQSLSTLEVGSYILDTLTPWLLALLVCVLCRVSSSRGCGGLLGMLTPVKDQGERAQRGGERVERGIFYDYYDYP